MSLYITSRENKEGRNEVRQISLSDYTLRTPNSQMVARFKEEVCGNCGLELAMADPVNPRMQGPNIITGECPKCGQVQPMNIPDYVDFSYNTKESMIEILLSRQNQMSGMELLARDKIARKILDCTDGHVLLEEEEWNKLVKAINTIKGLGRPDIELVHRILEAKEPSVEEKK